MKKGIFLLHYIPCTYFIICSLCILWNADMINFLGLTLLLLFSGLLFFRRAAFRMSVGGLMLVASFYFLLALIDEAGDVRDAGRDAGMLLGWGGSLIGLSALMSILLILPLNMPQKAAVYQRK